MESDRKALEQSALEKRQKLKDMQAQRDQLKSDSPQYSDLNRQLMQGSIEFDTWGQDPGAGKPAPAEDADDLAVQQDRRCYRRSRDAARDRPGDRRAAPGTADNLDQLNVDQVRMLINQRNVLFSNPAVDISAEVIAAMDAKYKAGK